MAEVSNITRSGAANVLGQKAHPTAHNRVRTVVVSMAAAYAALSAGDTVGTAIVIPAGSRLLGPVVLSNAANAASVTLAVGLRDAVTKAAVDATAILAATAITSAAAQALLTGTKLTGGQEYTLPQDCEVYLTFAGATSNANVQIRVEIPYVSP